MLATEARRAVLFDNLRQVFFLRLGNAAQFRIQIREEHARAALQALGGLASPW